MITTVMFQPIPCHIHAKPLMCLFGLLTYRHALRHFFILDFSKDSAEKGLRDLQQAYAQISLISV